MPQEQDAEDMLQRARDEGRKRRLQDITRKNKKKPDPTIPPDGSYTA